MRHLHDNLLAIWLTLVAIALAICWYTVPAPPNPKTLSPSAEPWQLPPIALTDTAKSLDTISTRNLWGTIAPVAADAVKEPEWRVLGIAHNGAERFILLAFDGKPAETLKVGDSLPDGAKIVQIENERFFVLTANKKKLAFGIYKNEIAKP